MTDLEKAEVAKDAQWYIAAADHYALLALLMQIPEPGTIESLLDARLVDDYRAIASEMGEGSQASQDIAQRFSLMQQELAAGEDPLGVLRREYTRAFAHPRRPPIKLNEALFVDDERARLGKEISYARLYVSPAAMDAERQYARAGVRVDNSEKRISADSITTELQFMTHLNTLMAKALVEGDEERQAQVGEWISLFKEKHVATWMPRFFERCAEETQHDFYKLVGEMGMLLMQLDGPAA